MSNTDTYGPEDIEQLMLEKTFDELYPEERAYVLKHVESRSEYERMRQMLLEFSMVDHEGEDFEAPVSMRDELMEMHEREKSPPKFAIWLNSFFAPPSSDTPVYRLPIVQLAGVAACVLIGLFLLREQTPDSQLALEKELIHTADDAAEKTAVDNARRTVNAPKEAKQEVANEPAPAEEETEAAPTLVEAVDQELAADLLSLDEGAREEPVEELTAIELLDAQTVSVPDNYTDVPISSVDYLMADEEMTQTAKKAALADDLDKATKSGSVPDLQAEAAERASPPVRADEYSTNASPQVYSAGTELREDDAYEILGEESQDVPIPPSTQLSKEMISILFTCR